MRIRWIVVSLLVTALLWGGSALAAEKIELQMKAEKEVVVKGKDGKEKVERTALKTAIPGDTVVYTMTYTNVSKETADDVVVADPLPKDMSYLDNSAFGAGSEITFSIDGGKSFATADKLFVDLGKGKKRPATGADYTNIRWKLKAPLPAGKGGFVSFKAKVK